MATAVPDLSRLKPAGGKRSSKREQIVNVFLGQDGHLSADDLVDVIRKKDHRISRATVYRTLQWMVDAGIARKVDFGEGRFRFEHSYRHPRHFHLICKTCHRSFEFLSSDIESLVEEVAVARRFTRWDWTQSRRYTLSATGRFVISSPVSASLITSASGKVARLRMAAEICVHGNIGHVFPLIALSLSGSRKIATAAREQFHYR